METVRVVTSQMVVGGAALAREESGRVVFVSGALPGETVDVALRTAKRDFAAGDVVGVVEASPDRVRPPCDAWHRGCGGCDWQHIDPHAQLRLKTEIVREALQRTGRITDPRVTAAAAIAPWGYRTTIRVAGRGDGAVGFRSRRSHEVVAIEHCPVAHERINEVLASRNVDGRKALHADIQIRVGAADGPVVVTGRDLSTAGGPTANGSTANGSTADPSTVYEDVGGHRLRVSAGSFFQSSPQSATLLASAVAAACEGVDMASTTVIDAYGGVGLFAVTVAADAAEVVVVESSPSSCADARHNLAGRRATVVESTVEDWAPRRAGLVIADPARNGLDKAGAAVVAATHSEVIVLVSCDAGSLARDCRLLDGYGYRHQGTQVLDLFPNTSHIETVTRFERG